MTGTNRAGSFMDDPSPDRPLTRSEKWMAGFFFLAILGLFAAEIAVDYHPVKLSALFIVVFWAPLLAVHEAGHAAMAAASGWRVLKMVIGFGRTVVRFKVRGIPVEVKLFPLEGFVRPAPANLHHPRLKNALIYLAGPLAETLLLGLVVLVAGPGRLLQRTESLPLIAAQSLAVAVLIGLFFNLIPHSVTTREGSTANDGLGVILSFVLPASHFRERISDGKESTEERTGKNAGNERT